MRTLPAFVVFLALLLSASLVRAGPGGIDTSFGSGGFVVTGVGLSSGRFTATALQSDGKLVAAGYCDNGNNSDFCVARYNVDGSRDLFFANGGKLTLPIFSGDDNLRAMAIQADGKIVLGGSCFNDVFSIFSFCVARLNADGSPDGSFGPATAKVVTAVGAGGDSGVAALALLADGRILAGGMCRDGGTAEMCMARYLANGDLDPSFGSGGLVIQGINASADEELNSLGLQADGKIVAGGSCHDGSKFLMCVARFEASGALDTSFGTNGATLITAGPDASFTYNVIVQPDGKILSAGRCSTPTYEFCVARLDATGALDTVGFGAGTGIARRVLLGQQDIATATVLQPDGNILMVGYCENGSQFDFCALRLLPDGDPDTGTFAPPTGSFFVPRVGNEHPYALVLQADGAFIAAGDCTDGVRDTPCAVRFLDNGTLDAGYGAGLILEHIGLAEGNATAAIVQPDGNIVVAGTCPGTLNDDVCVARFTSGGSFDPSFGGGEGRVMIPAVGQDTARAMLLQPDGKIVIGGFCDDGVTSNFDFCLSRLLADGSLDTPFGNLGNVVTPVLSEHDFLIALALQPDGRILAAGGCNASAIAQFCIVRYNADGSLDPAFGSGGIAIYTVGTEGDTIRAIAVQADGRIVLAGTCISSGIPRFCVGRLNADGTLDAAFGPGSPFAFLTFAHTLTASVNLVAGERILVGATCPGVTNADFCYLRLNTDGSVDASFAGSGYLVKELGGDNFLTSTAIQSDGKIVAAGQCLPSDFWLFCLARFNEDGTTDGAFGPGGQATTLVTGNSAFANAVAIGPDRRIVVAGFGSSPFARGFALARYLSAVASTITMTSTPSPSVYGTVVVLNATVLGSAPSGDVTFYNGATMLCQGTLNGSGDATCGSFNFPAGTYNWRAEYPGDANNLASTSPDYQHAVQRAPATVKLTGSRSRVPPGGRPVDFTATVANLGSAATGAVTFMDGAGALGSTNLTSGAAAVTANGITTLGWHSITVDFEGDANYLAATSNTFPLHVGVAADANGDGRGDLSWLDAGGQVASWLMNGTNVDASAILLGGGTGWTIKTADADFNADGRADILWTNTSGAVAVWLMDGSAVLDSALLIGGGDGWIPAHAADMDGDGRTDILWHNTDGRVGVWLMNGLSITSSALFLGPGNIWTPTHLADLSGDGRTDIIWRSSGGIIAAWLMDGLSLIKGELLFGNGGWDVTHAADFNGDGKADLLWQSTSGAIAIWTMDHLVPGETGVILGGGTGWTVALVADLDGDGRSDLVWENTDGRVSAWLMTGVGYSQTALLVDIPDGSIVTHARDFNGDGAADLVWQYPDGSVSVWLMAGVNRTATATIFFGGGGWVVSP